MQRCTAWVVAGVLAGSAVAHADPAPRTQTEVVVEHGNAQRRVALWTAVGGLGLIGSALAVGYVEARRWDDALARDDIDAANHAQAVSKYVGTGLFVGGVAALGVAAVIYATAPRWRERHINVAPVVNTTGGGITLTGGF